MDFLLDELSAIPYVIYGIFLLFVGMFLSDIFTGTVDKVFKRKD